MSGAAIPYLQTPAHIVNQALDRIGRPKKIIGDLSDGTDVAECARRNYGQLLRQLLRTAHWSFARKQDALNLLGDATGQTPNVSTQVDSPWTYAYEWPTDGVAAIWMPFCQPQTPEMPNGVPLTTGLSAIPPVPFLPSRFLVSSSPNYPVQTGDTPWAQQPDLSRLEGVGPVNRRVILTDTQNAQLVYTRLTTTIEEWDPSFREAFVMLLALILIPVAIEDPKERMAERNAIVPAVRNTIADARVANGNSAGFPQSIDHEPNWIRARSGGWSGYGSDWASGQIYYPWDGSMSWGGSVF